MKKINGLSDLIFFLESSKNEAKKPGVNESINKCLEILKENNQNHSIGNKVLNSINQILTKRTAPLPLEHKINDICHLILGESRLNGASAIQKKRGDSPKDLFNLILQEGEGTQTGQFLQAPPLREKLEIYLHTTFNTPHKCELFWDVCQAMLSVEKMVDNTHTIFYRSTPPKDYMINGLARRMKGIKKANFHYLSPPDQRPKLPSTVNKFISQQRKEVAKEGELEKNEWSFMDFGIDEELQENLKSANFCLFSNMGVQGEDSVIYFMDKHNASQAEALKGINAFLRSQGVDISKIPQDKKKEALNEIHDLKKEIITLLDQSSTGIFYQIAIPNEIVDDCAYLCIEGGFPYGSNACFDGVSYGTWELPEAAKPDPDTGRYESIEGFIQAMKRDPEAFFNDIRVPKDKGSFRMNNVKDQLATSEGFINTLQSRLFLTPTIFENPDSGIEMYLYGSFEKDAVDSKLDAFVQCLSKWGLLT